MKKTAVGICIGLLLLTLVACGGRSSREGRRAFAPGQTLRIVSGSENRELEPLIEDFMNKEGVKVEMTYMGSIDIMRQLSASSMEYDAVWPANSMWIAMGDQAHRVKHAESVSITPVVFGIKKSLAQDLGFVGRDDVSIKEIMTVIKEGKLRFTMTSATQSNSGMSAYMGFLYGLLGSPGMIREEDLDKAELKENITALLSGVERSSGSSEWLKTMFLNGDYDAMVNYESLVITTNEELKAQGREELYVVYPYDGLSISDSPLAYVDQGDSDKEALFLRFQSYLMSEGVQKKIQKYGRRTGFEGVAEENLGVFNATEGVKTDKILSPIQMPAPEVILKSMDLYQSEFRKPSLTVYVLDFSGSMSGKGEKELKAAMDQILDQTKAKESFLQAREGEENIAVLFSHKIREVYQASGAQDELDNMNAHIASSDPGGGTEMYMAAAEALNICGSYDVSQYNPAIILMTDGRSEGDIREFTSVYDEMANKIPVFTILFGNASEDQVQALAEYTNARVFDGRTDLIKAFRAAKGYN